MPYSFPHYHLCRVYLNLRGLVIHDPYFPDQCKERKLFEYPLFVSLSYELMVVCNWILQIGWESWIIILHELFLLECLLLVFFSE